MLKLLWSVMQMMLEAEQNSLNNQKKIQNYLNFITSFNRNDDDDDEEECLLNSHEHTFTCIFTHSHSESVGQIRKDIIVISSIVIMLVYHVRVG